MDSFHNIIARFISESTILEVQTLLPGDTPSYTGTAPTKPGAVFNGWEPSIAPIYQNTDYTAVFVDLLTYQYLKGTLQTFVDNDITSVSSYGLYGRTALKSVESSSITSIGSYGFGSCTSLETVDLKSTSPVTIAANAFNGATALKDLIIRSSSVSTLSNTNAFTGTLIASGNGGIFVPDSLLASYKSASNWSTYENNIFSIDDYPLNNYS